MWRALANAALGEACCVGDYHTRSTLREYMPAGIEDDGRTGFPTQTGLC